jgi:RimJ/RimL family protein N-acetyltransferase
MQRWTTIPSPYTGAHAESFIEDAIRRWDAGEVADFAVQLDGRFAGSVSLRLLEGAWADIGFGLAPWARGAGVMTTAVDLVLSWGIEELNLEGFHWCAHVGNTASRRVAERCGFRVEGTVRGLLAQRGKRVDGWIGSLAREDRVLAPAASNHHGPARDS